MKKRVVTFIKYAGLSVVGVLVVLVIIGSLVPKKIEYRVDLVERSEIRPDGVLEIEVLTEGDTLYKEYIGAMGAIGDAVHFLREKNQEVAGIEALVHRKEGLALRLVLGPEALAAFPERANFKRGDYGSEVIDHARFAEVHEEGGKLLSRFCEVGTSAQRFKDLCAPYEAHRLAKLEQERAEQERVEAERAAKERAEQERVEAERAAAEERAAKKRAAKERAEVEQAGGDPVLVRIKNQVYGVERIALRPDGVLEIDVQTQKYKGMVSSIKGETESNLAAMEYTMALIHIGEFIYYLQLENKEFQNITIFIYRKDKLAIVMDLSTSIFEDIFSKIIKQYGEDIKNINMPKDVSNLYAYSILEESWFKMKVYEEGRKMVGGYCEYMASNSEMDAMAVYVLCKDYFHN